MDNYIEYYRMADMLLKLIIQSKDKMVIRKRISRDYQSKEIPELLAANGLIEIVNSGSKQEFRITAEGEKHLKSGGFIQSLGIETRVEPEVSFRNHLESNTNLLTVFGILNALIIFAGQGKPVDSSKLDLFNNGMQFISVCTYLLSIMVMIEILNNTRLVANKSWKFEAFFFCIAITTAGIGLIFLYNYGGLLVSLGMVFGFLVVAGMVAGLLTIINFIVPKKWRKGAAKYEELIRFAQILLGLLTTYYVFKSISDWWRS